MLGAVDVIRQIATYLSDVMADFARDQVKPVDDGTMIAFVLSSPLFDQRSQDYSNGSDDGNHDAFHGYAPSALLMAASMPALSNARRGPTSM